MKNILLILFIIFFQTSCIDIFTYNEENYYESVHIQGGGWLKFYEENSINQLMFENDFTFQVWFSGQLNTDDEANCILSINGLNTDINIYRNPTIHNQLMVYDNTILISILEFDNFVFNQNESFILLTVRKSQNQICIDFNNDYTYNDSRNSLCFDNNETLNLIVGANLENDYPENLWYGYIDEIRLWDVALQDSIINFHNMNPDKISSSYNDEHLTNLIGLWDFRIDMEQESFSNIFQDIYQNPIFINLFTLDSAINKMSQNGR